MDDIESALMQQAKSTTTTRRPGRPDGRASVHRERSDGRQNIRPTRTTMADLLRPKTGRRAGVSSHTTTRTTFRSRRTTPLVSFVWLAEGVDFVAY